MKVKTIPLSYRMKVHFPSCFPSPQYIWTWSGWLMMTNSCLAARTQGWNIQSFRWVDNLHLLVFCSRKWKQKRSGCVVCVPVRACVRVSGCAGDNADVTACRCRPGQIKSAVGFLRRQTEENVSLKIVLTPGHPTALPLSETLWLVNKHQKQLGGDRESRRWHLWRHSARSCTAWFTPSTLAFGSFYDIYLVIDWPEQSFIVGSMGVWSWRGRGRTVPLCLPAGRRKK